MIPDILTIDNVFSLGLKNEDMLNACKNKKSILNMERVRYVLHKHACPI